MGISKKGTNVLGRSYQLAYIPQSEVAGCRWYGPRLPRHWLLLLFHPFSSSRIGCETTAWYGITGGGRPLDQRTLFLSCKIGPKTGKSAHEKPSFLGNRKFCFQSASKSRTSKRSCFYME